MKTSFPQEPKCFRYLLFKIWNSCTLYFLERSLILKFWKWTAFILKMKNSVPKESQHLVSKTHPFLLLCPVSVNGIGNFRVSRVKPKYSCLRFLSLVFSVPSVLSFPFPQLPRIRSHPGLHFFSYSPYPIHQQILQNIVRIWPLFPTTTVTTMAQAIIVSHLAYCTGFLTGLLSPAFELQLQSILNKADCDHGSPLLKTSSGFFT